MKKQITIPVVSEWLKVPESTLLRWISQGVIPFTMMRGQYVIEKETLEAWAASKHIYLNRITEYEKDHQTELLIPAMEAGGCYYLEEIPSMMDLFQEVERLIDLKGKQQVPLSQLLLMRELVTPTAIGRGVAVPQPRFPLEDIIFQKPVVHTFFLKFPMDFNALDTMPVFVIFVLLCSHTGHHLEVLSQLASIIRDDDICKFLKTYPSKDELVEQFKKIYRGAF
ncbi:MAG: PTS sugar transporter subunit IIA [SAR324 cluster bacterium]|nr:PTS sugar transporter subunit IIA [SAR324 cluster bacterium]